MHRRQLLAGLPAVWLSTHANAEPKLPEVETLEAVLEKLRLKIHQDMPDLSSVEITYDPANIKVPLMVLALRV